MRVLRSIGLKNKALHVLQGFLESSSGHYGKDVKSLESEKYAKRLPWLLDGHVPLADGLSDIEGFYI